MKRRDVFCLSALMILFAAHTSVVGQSAEVSNDLPTVEQVLARYIEAVGGRDALEKLATRECSGVLTDDLSSRIPPVHREVQFATLSKTPNLCLIMYNASGAVERSGFDGDIGWRQDSAKVQADESIGRDKLSWLINPQGAMRVKEYFPDLFVRGTESHGDTTVVVLESKQLDNTYSALYFDAATGLLVQIGYYWHLDEYRAVDGVLLPHRIVMSRKGGYSSYEFRKIKHNVPLAESVFSSPDPASGGSR